MNKKQLVAEIAQECGIKKKEALMILETTISKISDTLIDGDKVMISGFGTFNIRHRNGKMCYNPKTKKRTEVFPSTALIFKPSKAIKGILNADTGSLADKKSAV